MVSVKRDVAEATRPELGGAYEGCLDQFERGMSTERLREVFAELKSGLVPLLRAIQQKVIGFVVSGVVHLLPWWFFLLFCFGEWSR